MRRSEEPHSDLLGNFNEIKEQSAANEKPRENGKQGREKAGETIMVAGLWPISWKGSKSYSRVENLWIRRIY